ncbi:hypothetical protein [Dyella kyungheensis]|uniref:Uncharacterized protein n=1 Tax=Dyella kyungheensis TaxID=1242174 RepID=A0ABS2JTC8_9GAMM|nr:hypothetical protein [Dyella kyungheensis]MBM7122131.1 hypothetical protein [Dyella kyungheensis]
MRRFFKRTLPSGHARASASQERASATQYGFLAILGLGVMLTLHRGSHASVALMALGMLGILCGESLTYFLRLSPRVLRRAKKTLSDRIAAFHAILPAESELTRGMEWVWCGIFLASVLMIFWPALVGRPHIPCEVMNGLLLIIVIAGANEWRHYIQGLLRRSWARGVGKLVLTSAGGILLCVATAEARQFTFLLTHEDAALFPSFVGVMAFVLLPAIYFSGLCIVALAVACVHTIIVLGRMGARSLLGQANADSPPASSLRDTTPCTTASSPPALRRFTRVFRPLSRLLTVIVIALMAPQLDLSNYAFVQKAARIMLARLEYWPRNVCGDSHEVHAVKLDANHYSVATANGFNVAISTLTCPGLAPPPPHEASATH